MGAEGTQGGLKRRPEILGMRDGRGVPEITAVISLAAGVRAGKRGRRNWQAGPAGQAEEGQARGAE